MYQSQKQELRPLTSAHLAQTMTILSLSADEIREKIANELSLNPALELIEERVCPTCHRPLPEKGICQYCFTTQAENPEGSIVFVSPRDDFAYDNYNASREGSSREIQMDSIQYESLATYVLRQIGPDLKEDEKMIAAHLLTGLDDDGFLTTSLMEVVQYYHVPPSKVEAVIQLIQHADPIGVGTRNPQEALLVQLNHLRNLVKIPNGAYELIQESYEDLIHGKYRELTKRHNLSMKQIQNVEKFIGENLNPFPGRADWGEKGFSNGGEIDTYHYPDVLIYYLNENPKNRLVVEVIMPISGYLKVNEFFKKEFKNAPNTKTDEWKTDIDRASLLVKCLNQRNNTMVRLMEILVDIQEDFIRHGDMNIIPITRAQISRELNVHESTISRAVSNKTVMLPNRKVVPLSAFFDRSLNVRTIIKDLVRDEKKPLTDQKIVELLDDMGIDIARRTVAKYRAMEGILPAHMRNAISQRI